MNKNTITSVKRWKVYYLTEIMSLYMLCDCILLGINSKLLNSLKNVFLTQELLTQTNTEME